MILYMLYVLSMVIIIILCTLFISNSETKNDKNLW